MVTEMDVTSIISRWSKPGEVIDQHLAILCT